MIKLVKLNESGVSTQSAATEPYSDKDAVISRIDFLRSNNSKPKFKAELRALELGMKLTGNNPSKASSALASGLSAMNSILAKYSDAYDYSQKLKRDTNKIAKSRGLSDVFQLNYDDPAYKVYGESIRKYSELQDEVVEEYETKVIPALALLGKVKYSDGTSMNGSGRVTCTDDSVSFRNIQKSAGFKGSKIIKAWEVF